MTQVFLKLLNMSIAASWLVLAVILLRILLKKTPRWIVCLLWGIVALRLTIPVSFESAFSLIPSAEVIPLDVAVSETPAIYSGIPAVNSAVNPLFTQHFSDGGNGLETILFVAAMVWLAGVVVMLLYSAVTREATCTHQGSRLRECVSCGKQVTEAIESLGHIAAGPVFFKEPNCTEQGAQSATCANCHGVFVTQVLPTNDDHDLKETVLKEATCAHPGEGVYTCTRCDYSQSCSYAKLAHQYTKSNVVAATCLKNGVEQYTCGECGDSYQAETPLGEHTYIKGAGTKVTCMGSGFDSYICTVCNVFYGGEIPPKGHSWERTGRGYSVCTSCGMRGAEDYSLFSNDSDDDDSLFPEIRIWP